MSKLFVIVVVLLAVFQAPVALADHVARCVYNCLKYTSQPCRETSHSALNTCIDTSCLTSASQININLSPKAEYSCQNSYIPGSSNASPVLKLNGTRNCATSTFEFLSFFASAGFSSRMDVVAQRCQLMLYERAECNGASTAVDLGGLTSNKCTFKGWRSGRLDCGVQVDYLAAHHALENVCSNFTSPKPNATAPYPTRGFNITFSPTGSVTAVTSSFNITSSTTGPVTALTSIPATRTPTAPFADTAKNDRDAKPSVAAFVALIAAALAML